MSYLKSVSSNLLTCKVPSKNKKTLNLGPTIPYLGIFGLRFDKKLLIFNQHPRICENIKFHPKQKKYSWNKQCSNWVFGLECWKTIVIFVIPPIYLMAKFRTKIRILKFGSKNPSFGCFGQQFWKAIVTFEISALQFTLLQSLVQKIRIL